MQIRDLAFRFRAGPALLLKKRREQSISIPRPTGRLFDFLLHSRRFRAQQPCLLQQTLVRLARLSQNVGVVPRQNKIAYEVQQQRIENLKPVRIVDEIPEQYVVLQKKIVIIPVFNEKTPVL